MLKCQIYEGLEWSEEDQKASLQFDRTAAQDVAGLPSDFHRNAIAYYQTSTLTPTYKILFDMPKGVLHHLHFDCSESRAFLLQMSRHPHVYLDPDKRAWRVSTEQNAKAQGFIRAEQLKPEFQSEGEWEDHVVNLSQMSLHQVSREGHNLWALFEDKIMAMADICHSRELGPAYIRDSFGHYQRQKYLRVQARALILPGVDKDGRTFTELQFLEQFVRAEEELREKSPFSIGIIVQGLKMWPGAELLAYWQRAASLKHRLLVGIDAVQEEDKFNQIPAEIQYYTKGRETCGLPFVLHAGSNLNNSNLNVHYALQLGTVRIGHGLNLFQHSYLFQEVKRRDVCLEVNPLSNQLLNQVADLRLHPAVAYHNYGLPISISPDDPSRFGVHGATFDWFVAVASFGFRLRDLKKVARGSIKHALCGEELKSEMFKQFDAQWREFVLGLLSK